MQGRSQKGLGLLEVPQHSGDPTGLELRLSESERPAVAGELLLQLQSSAAAPRPSGQQSREAEVGVTLFRVIYRQVWPTR